MSCMIPLPSQLLCSAKASKRVEEVPHCTMHARMHLCESGIHNCCTQAFLTAVALGAGLDTKQVVGSCAKSKKSSVRNSHVGTLALYRLRKLMSLDLHGYRLTGRCKDFSGECTFRSVQSHPVREPKNIFRWTAGCSALSRPQRFTRYA
jgi:hypothetical protein